MSTLTELRPDLQLDAIIDATDLSQLRKFTREEFYAMDHAGIFDDDRRVELIDGRVITDTTPVTDEHSWGVERLNRALMKCTDGTKYRVRVQSGISMPGGRELQPDFAICLPSADGSHRNPTADQIVLVVEVSDSSLSNDRTAKMQRYAAGNIPTYWVVDVPHRRVFVYRDPEDGVYSRMEPYSGQDNLEFAGMTIRVADIF